MAKDGRNEIAEKLSRWDGINVVTIEPSTEKRPEFKAMEDNEMELRYGDDAYRLRDLAFEKVGRLCGIPATYMRKTPTALFEPHFNWWFREFPFVHMVYDETRENQVVTLNRTKNFRVVRPSDMFDVVDSKIREEVSDNVIYDKVHVSADKIAYSIVSERSENMGTPKKGDMINAGMRVDMSPMGEHATSIGLYMLRLVCTNGARVPLELAKLRMSATDQLEDWVGNVIPNLLEKSIEEFSRIRALQGIDVADLGSLIQGLFDRVTLTSELRESLTNSFLNAEVDTMYDFYNHITEFANRFDASSDIMDIERLQTAAGFVSAHEFCDKCQHALN